MTIIIAATNRNDVSWSSRAVSLPGPELVAGAESMRDLVAGVSATIAPGS
jgi:hypothetical protein